MAADLLLLVKGMKGESGDHQFPEAMRLFSWTLHLDGNVQGSGNATRRGGRAETSELTITCPTDRMVSTIAAEILRGTTHTATLIQRRPGGGDPPETAIRVEMTDVLFTGISWAAGESGLPVCTVGLNFRHITVEYFEQSTDSGQQGPVFSWTWDAFADVAH